MPRSRRRSPAPIRVFASLWLLPLLLVGLVVLTNTPSPATPNASAPAGTPATAAFEIGPERPDACLPDDTVCLVAAMGNLAYLAGPAAGIDALQVAVERSPAFGGVCHVAAHRVGAGTMARNNGDFAAATAELRIAQNSAYCGSGALHGILIELTASSGSPDLVETLRTACSGAIDSSGDPVGNCAHGAGHAIVQARGWEIDQAIADCQRLGAIPGERHDSTRECAIGAYMEVMQNGRRIATAAWVRAEDPSWPCPIISDQTADLCWGLVDVAAGIEGIGIEEVIALCSTAEQIEYRRACRISAAEGATQMLADVAAVDAFCVTYANADLDADTCRLWAGAQMGGDRQHPEPAAELCRAISDSTMRDDCFAGMGAKLFGQVGIAPCGELRDEIERRACERSILPGRPGLP